MDKVQFSQPSKETLKKILNFFLGTSVPRILAEKKGETSVSKRV
jgi:hypothetical protein